LDQNLPLVCARSKARSYLASRARLNSFLYGVRQIGHRRDYRSCARHPKLVGELGGRVASAHESDRAHARRNRGAYTERRIFYDDAVGGSCSDRASRKEVEIGGGLALL